MRSHFPYQMTTFDNRAITLPNSLITATNHQLTGSRHASTGVAAGMAYEDTGAAQAGAVALAQADPRSRKNPARTELLVISLGQRSVNLLLGRGSCG